MTDGLDASQGFEDITFRANTKVFIVYIIFSILMMFLLIGFIILPLVIIWYKCTRIILGSNSVTLRKGWLSVTNKQVPYDKINTVEIRRSVADRFFGSGQLQIYTGNDIKSILFPGIEHPEKVKAIIEERSHALGVHGLNNAPPKEASVADEIAKFAALKANGAITEAEFLKKKNQLLGE